MGETTIEFEATEAEAEGRNGQPAAPMNGDAAAHDPGPPALDRDAEKLRQIAEANAEVEQRHAMWQEAKEVASERKGIYDDAARRLSLLIKELVPRPRTPQEEPLPLIDGVEARTPADDLSWRDLSILELGVYGLSAPICSRLADAGIATFGDLADWTATEKQLSDIKGIGGAKAEKIEDALAAYWSDHPRDEAVPVADVKARDVADVDHAEGPA